MGAMIVYLLALKLTGVFTFFEDRFGCYSVLVTNSIPRI